MLNTHDVKIVANISSLHFYKVLFYAVHSDTKLNLTVVS